VAKVFSLDNLPPAGNLEEPGTELIIAGWGTLSSGGSLPNTQQKAVVPVGQQTTCRSQYGQNAILDSMICAGYSEGGIDTCQGDSGGPMFQYGNDGHYYVVGIVSWGSGCASPNFMGVYTRVSSFVDWLCLQESGLYL
jgi:secreted trypsin-like serine protease